MKTVLLSLLLTLSVGAVTLRWNSVTNVAGYYIYSGVVSNTYTKQIDVGKTTTNTVLGLLGGTNFYFAVTAYASNRAESDFSNVYFWREPAHSRPIVQVFGPKPTLIWEAMPGVAYRVVAAPTLDFPWFGWIEITGDLFSQTGNIEWTDSETNKQRFYRVLVY